MDGDHKRQKNKFRDSSSRMPNDSNVLQPFWVRRAFCVGNEMDRFLLDYGFNFLLPFGAFLWLVFLLA
jgi:hypothetical protein